MIAFNASDVPETIDYMPWTELDDDTMRINLGVIGNDEYSSSYFAVRGNISSEYLGKKYFSDLAVFDDGDGSSPRSYRTFVYDSVTQSWAFPYKIWQYDKTGNNPAYTDEYLRITYGK